MTRLRRITIDRDSKNLIKNIFYLVRTFKFLNGKKGEKIIIKKSNSKGYHIFLWTRSAGDKFKIKDYLGNDKIQTRMDMKHRRGRQTLFNRKKKIYKIKKEVNK